MAVLRLLVLLVLLSLAAADLPPFALEGVVTQAQLYAYAAPRPTSSGVTQKSYLDTVAGVFEYFRQFQNQVVYVLDLDDGIECVMM